MKRALAAALTALAVLVDACAPVMAPMPAPPPALAPVVEAPRVPAAPTPAPTAQPAARPAPAAALQRVLDQVDDRHQGRIGVVVEHLVTGERASLNARGQFRAASLYKLFVMHAAFARMRAGDLSVAEQLRFGETAFAKEPYGEWPVGTRASASCALEAMIGVSHNAASAMLIDRLGGEERITAEAWEQLGVDATTITVDRAYTSPEDVARLLELIYRGEAVDSAASAAMLALLADQQKNDRIPLSLPADVVVAHKTGELAKLRHDAGIVFAPSGPYVLVAMVQDAPSDAAAREAVLDLSRAVYAHFEGESTADHGMPPRLAREVLQTPDAKGRLTPLADHWTQTRPLKRAGVAVADGAAGATLRDVAVPDLLALQQAAAAAGAPFWVTAGHREPTGAESSKAAPPVVVGCDYQLPPKRSAPAAAASPATASASAAPAAATAAKTPASASTPAPSSHVATARVGASSALPPRPAPSQHWLGTVVALSDSATGEHAVAAFAPSATGRWLLDHAWEHGFVPALPESAAGAELGYEPWTLRWVGREMAAELRARTGGDPAKVGAALRLAAGELATPPREDASAA